MKKDIEQRRMRAAERVKTMSSAEGEENFSPLSPRASAHKVLQHHATSPAAGGSGDGLDVLLQAEM